MRDYTKIEAWRLTDNLTVALYEATKTFPREETYGLTSQLLRAGYSAPANIVEGAARESKRDYLHFLHIARGSLSESQYFIHLAHRLGYLSDADRARLHELSRESLACLHGLIKAVAKEAGVISRVAASARSLLVLLLLRFTPANLA
jgi:four helix bundle protein